MPSNQHYDLLNGKKRTIWVLKQTLQIYDIKGKHFKISVIFAK